jgi:hypothetical protein
MASGKNSLHHDIIWAYSVRGQILKAPARKTRIGFGLCFICSQKRVWQGSSGIYGQRPVHEPTTTRDATAITRFSTKLPPQNM